MDIMTKLKKIDSRDKAYLEAIQLFNKAKFYIYKKKNSVNETHQKAVQLFYHASENSPETKIPPFFQRQDVKWIKNPASDAESIGYRIFEYDDEHWGLCHKPTYSIYISPKDDLNNWKLVRDDLDSYIPRTRNFNLWRNKENGEWYFLIDDKKTYLQLYTGQTIENLTNYGKIFKSSFGYARNPSLALFDGIFYIYYDYRIDFPCGFHGGIAVAKFEDLKKGKCISDEIILAPIKNDSFTVTDLTDPLCFKFKEKYYLWFGMFSKTVPCNDCKYVHIDGYAYADNPTGPYTFFDKSYPFFTSDYFDGGDLSGRINTMRESCSGVVFGFAEFSDRVILYSVGYDPNASNEGRLHIAEFLK